MFEGESGIMLLGVCVVAGIVGVFAILKVARMVYNNNAQAAAEARNADYAQAQAQREAQAAKVADAEASNYGFSNAQEARDSGIDV